MKSVVWSASRLTYFCTESENVHAWRSLLQTLLSEFIWLFRFVSQKFRYCSGNDSVEDEILATSNEHSSPQMIHFCTVKSGNHKLITYKSQTDIGAKFELGYPYSTDPEKVRWKKKCIQNSNTILITISKNKFKIKFVPYRLSYFGPFWFRTQNWPRNLFRITRIWFSDLGACLLLA